MKKKILMVVLSVAALAALILGATLGYKYLSKIYAPETNDAPTTLKAAADFTVLNSAGEQVTLSSKIGKPIVVNFWATWCGPCQSEMPAFDAMHRKYGDKVTFMMIDLTDGSRDTVESAAAFVKERGYGFPVYFDTTLSAANSYGAYSIPLSVFINKNGEIVTTHTGAMDEATLENYIKTIL